MRLGIIGTAQGGTLEQLRSAVELFFGDPQLKQIIYLGDDAALDEVAAQLAHEQLDEAAFLQRGAELAVHGTADALEQLLRADREAERLSVLRHLPEAPACAIEMLEKWVVLAVHDKAVLEEDDVANAQVIIYGESDEAAFKRFGPRAFLTPGPLHKGCVGSISLRDDGSLDIAILDLQGAILQSDSIAPATGKVVVTS
jgi:hypothetical protein